MIDLHSGSLSSASFAAASCKSKAEEPMQRQPSDASSALTDALRRAPAPRRRNASFGKSMSL